MWKCFWVHPSIPQNTSNKLFKYLIKGIVHSKINMLSSFTHPHWFSKSVWPSFLRGYSEKWLFFFVQWYSVWFNVAWIPVFLCVFHKKETYSGLKQHENVKMTKAFSFLIELSLVLSRKKKNCCYSSNRRCDSAKGWYVVIQKRETNKTIQCIHTYESLIQLHSTLSHFKLALGRTRVPFIEEKIWPKDLMWPPGVSWGYWSSHPHLWGVVETVLANQNRSQLVNQSKQPFN